MLKLQSFNKIVILLFFIITLMAGFCLAANTDFVQRDGSFFRRGTQRFYFLGANTYYLMMFAADSGTRVYVDEVLNEAKLMKLKVIRLWAFNDKPGDWNCLQSKPGVFDERVFRGLDYVLAKANELNLRVILTLVNNWQDYGGMDQYVAWDKKYGTSPEVAQGHNDFYTDPDCRKWYKNFATVLMNRKNTINNRIYKDDPTIFAWELANEPRGPGDASRTLVKKWAEEMSFYIKNVIRIKQMLTVGLEGIDNIDSTTGTNFFATNSLDDIDFATVHLWPEKRSQSIDQSIAWLNSRINLAQLEINKPLVVEEAGYSRSPSQNTDYRDDLFRKIFNKIFDKKAGGAIIWALYHDSYPDYDGYGVYYPRDTATVNILSYQAGRNPFRVLKVPQQYNKIQSAIDAASPGDIILISPGVYYENLRISNITQGVALQGINRNTCIIDGKRQGRAIDFSPSALPCRISGLTIRNGSLASWGEMGAGIRIVTGTDVEISNCIIAHNEITYNGDTGSGGGIYCASSSGRPLIEIKNNLISDNSVAYSGGGILLSPCIGPAKILNNVITNNTAHIYGGGISMTSGEVVGNVIEGNQAHEYGGAGIYCGWQGVGIYLIGHALIANNIIKNNVKFKGGSFGNDYRAGGGILNAGLFEENYKVTIINNVFYGNKAYHGFYNGRGGAVAIFKLADDQDPEGLTDLKNNIFYGNDAQTQGDEIFCESGARLRITYSLVDPHKVYGADLGKGCISGNPRFQDTLTFHLRSDSPAIDAGDPKILDLDSSRSDMGVYGGPDSL